MGVVDIPHDPASAGVVRHRLAADLVGQGVVLDSVDEVVLVASELVGNAIRHTPANGNELRVTWRLEDDDVIVSVTDSGAGWPAMRNAADRELSGRGLAIVNTLSREWGVDAPDVRAGKQVWARVPVRRARALF